MENINEQLVTEIKEAEGEARKEKLMELWENNLPVIRQTVRRYCPDQTEDGMQTAFLAMMQAADGWQDDGGANFLTYFRRVMIQTLIREIVCRNTVHISEYAQRLAAVYKRFESDFFLEEGRYPTNYETSQELDIPLDQVQDLRKASLALETQSMDVILPGTDDVTLEETLEDPAANFADGVISDQAADEILEVMRKELTEEEQDVILQRADGKTFDEIGDSRNQTGKQARTVYLRASRKMRNCDYFFTDLYHGSLGSFQNSWISVVEKAVINKLEGW